MVAMIIDEDQLRADAAERQAIESEARGDEAADRKLELLERLLAGATEKRDWVAVQRHASALAAAKAGRTHAWPRIVCPELLAPLPPIPWVCESIELAPGPVTLVAGYGYSGKTAACQALALAVATGTPAWGAYPVRQGRVLHVDYEQGRRLTVERYQRLARALAASGACPPESMALLGTSLAIAIAPPDVLDGPKSEDSYCRELEGHTLCVVDSFSAGCPATKENEASASQPLIMLSRVSERTGCTIVVIHHERKEQAGAPGGGKQALRGSSSIFAAPQVVLRLSADGAPEASRGSNYALASSTKNRVTGRTVEPFVLRFCDVDEQDLVSADSRFGLRVSVEATSKTDAQDKAIDAVADRVLVFVRAHAGCSSAEIKAGVRGDTGQKAAALDRLKRAGAITNRGGSGGPGKVASWYAV